MKNSLTIFGMTSLTVLVWPWSSSDLVYHVIVDTFLNGPPDEPRNILPPACFPDPSNTAKLPEPVGQFNKTVTAGDETFNLNLLFIAGAGLPDKDPNKARIDRARVTVNVSAQTLDRILVLVGAKEKLDYLVAFHALMFAKGIENVPTFFVSVDDDSGAKVKAIQDRAMVAFGNFGGSWEFRNISGKPTESEVSSVFSDIFSSVAAAATSRASSKASLTKTTTTTTTATTSAGGGSSERRRGCLIL